jgi:hypothetical protein
MPQWLIFLLSVLGVLGVYRIWQLGGRTRQSGPGQSGAGRGFDDRFPDSDMRSQGGPRTWCLEARKQCSVPVGGWGTVHYPPSPAQGVNTSDPLDSAHRQAQARTGEQVGGESPHVIHCKLVPIRSRTERWPRVSVMAGRAAASAVTPPPRSGKPTSLACDAASLPPARSDSPSGLGARTTFSSAAHDRTDPAKVLASKLRAALSPSPRPCARAAR